MGKTTRKEYLKAIRGRYGKAGRKEKKLILDEFCKVCGYNRKYALRLLNAKPKPPAKRPGP
ncbi:MAG TPA: integrase, partial [Nitrospirae bacterium]|nr:integrase [Nitrospirota bacterium]